MTKITYRTVGVDGMKIFYREAGPTNAPTLLLLHGFPTSSHMFRDLIPLLADRFHIVAPDLPGFGQSDLPSRDAFTYTFARLAEVIGRFTEVVKLKRFAIYIFDYGAPVGLRIALKHPERVTAIISQNGNAYEEGLSDGWNPIQTYWREPTKTNREALRSFLSPETTVWQYTHGVSDPSVVSPDGYSLDNFYLTRPGAHEAQLDLFLDYASNVALYPQFQDYFRNRQPRTVGDLGTQRSVLPAGRGRSLQARHLRRGCSLPRYRPLRVGNALSRNCYRHSRLHRPNGSGSSLKWRRRQSNKKRKESCPSP